MEQVLSAQEWQLLCGCALFQGCGREQVRLALEDAACNLGVYETGQTVYRPEQFSRCLGVLLSGGIRVTRDSLAISVLSPGELFGAAALFNDRPDYATTLTACAPCRVVLLTTLAPGRTRLSCPATELAQRLGISRASLYRAFDTLEEQGLIRREGRSIVVPDLSALDASSL